MASFAWSLRRDQGQSATRLTADAPPRSAIPAR
jgi:hypothetical protein